MEDFYNQFRDNLENRPEPAFREGDWKDLENRLDKQGGKGGGFAWWWIALPLFALLLASNLFFFLEWKNIGKNYTKVEMRTDTVYQTHVVYTTDTIFQTRVIRETKVEYLNSPSFALDSKYFNPAGTQQSSTGNPALVLYNDHFKTIIPTQNNLPTLNTYQQWKKENNPTEPKSEEILAILNKETAYLVSKTTGLLADPAFPVLELEDIIIQKKKRTLNQQLYMMRPKGFSIGFNAGWAKPISEHIESGKGYSIGLHANIKFSDHLRMWLDGSFLRTNYETDQQNPAYGVPDISTQPPVDFQFEKAKVPQPTLQYAAGLQYLFNTKKKWKPTVGIGFGAVSLLSYELLFEYENENNDSEWNFDQRVQRNDQLLNFLFFRAGFEHNLNNHWDWHILATYRTQWNDSKFKTLPTLGIQTGLSYRF